MDTFSMSWSVMLSVRIIPRGDTLRVTFCGFFPLALAWGQTWVRGACGPVQHGTQSSWGTPDRRPT